jgi:hypothetical protein
MKRLCFFSLLPLMKGARRVKWRLSLTSYIWLLCYWTRWYCIILHRCLPKNLTCIKDLGFVSLLILWSCKVQKTAGYLAYEYTGNAVCWLHESSGCMKNTSLKTQYSTIYCTSLYNIKYTVKKRQSKWGVLQDNGWNIPDIL